ncbi:MAG TPA: hypothetical protein VL123_04265 [Candidatus Udaeobacter sp.]|nr:hypothetical protein [Candidatus Udaeobacter sp.]
MHHRSWSRWVCAVMTLAATGCTALRDIPRDQFGARPERKNVHIETRDGLVYEFDYVRLQGDSLVGFRRRDVEASVDEFATVPMPLEDVTHMSARGVDWRRTGLVGGGALAAVLAAGIAAGSRGSSNTPTSGGGKGGGVP